MSILFFLFVNNLYGAVATHSIIYNFKPNKAENIYTLDFIKKFDNTIVINNLKEFESLLSKNPVSKSLRFIFIDLGNNIVDSNVYEIDINANYKKVLKNSLFDEILNTKQVLKPDTSWLNTI